METLYLTKITPIRGDDFEIRGWAPAGRVLIPSRNLLCAEEKLEMDGKVVVTLLGGRDFVVEEKIDELADCVLENVGL